MKILLSLNNELLKDVDLYCQKYHFSRSEFLRNLIRQKLFGSPDGKIIISNRPELPRKILPNDAA